MSWAQSGLNLLSGKQYYYERALCIIRLPAETASISWTNEQTKINGPIACFDKQNSKIIHIIGTCGNMYDFMLTLSEEPAEATLLNIQN